MNRKAIAAILLVAGLMFFPPLNVLGLGGLAWPTSFLLFIVGGVLLATSKAKAQPVVAGGPELKPGEVPMAEGWTVPRQHKSTVLIERVVDRTVVSLIPAHAPKATGWPMLVGITMGGLGLGIGGVVSALDHTPVYALSGLGIGVVLALISSHKLNNDPRGQLFATRIKATSKYLDARNAAGQTPTYDLSKIDRIRKRSVYQREQGAHRIQEERSAWFADHSFIIEITYEGRNIVLANGLDEPTAESAYQAISKQIGLS